MEQNEEGLKAERRKYEVVHSIRRDGNFSFYEDYHSLICQIRDLNIASSEPLGSERVELGTCTIQGTYPKDYKPYVYREGIDGLAKKVAQNFPFLDGDEIETPSRFSFINVIQFPLEAPHLEFFRNKLIEYLKEK